jgi:deoxyribonuclease-4
MSKEIPGIKPCLDFAHLHARPGDGSVNSYDEWARMLELYGRYLGNQAFGDLHVHLSGIQYGSKGEREHLMIENADLDIPALFSALRDFGCGGRILCESPIMEDDAQRLQQTWLELNAA